MPYTTLISATDLAAHLHDTNWVVCDCRHDLADTEAGRRAWAESHIPGARFVHLDEDLSAPKTGTNGRHPLPDPAAFTRRLGSLGIDGSKQVVAYDASGGYYAARAGSMEPRLAAVISHGAIWSIYDLWRNADESHGLASHIKWVFGVKTMQEAIERFRAFTLDGVLEHMRCPYLIVHGGHDVLGMSQATRTYEYAKSKAVNVTLRFVTPEETGAEHCQHDNPTIGQELMADWLADKFGIDQRELMKQASSPLL